MKENTEETKQETTGSTANTSIASSIAGEPNESAGSEASEKKAETRSRRRFRRRGGASKASSRFDAKENEEAAENNSQQDSAESDAVSTDLLTRTSETAIELQTKEELALGATAEESTIIRRRKKTRYYVDLENVHSAGLSGANELSEEDQIIIFYSLAADSLHIDQIKQLMEGKAAFTFIEVDRGTPNALDFQLITMLFAQIDESFDSMIVSGDTGYDAAIKMAKRMGLPRVERIVNLKGETKKPRGRSGGRTAAKTEALPEKLEVTFKPSRTLEAAHSRQDKLPEGKADNSTKQALPPSPSAEASQNDVIDVKPAEPSCNNTQEGKLTEPKQADAEGSGKENADSKKESPRKKEPRSKKTNARKQDDSHQKDAGEQSDTALGTEASIDNAAVSDNAKPKKENEPASKDENKAEPAGKEESMQPLREKVEKLLEANNVSLSSQQINTLVEALESTQSKHTFYTKIIQLERQKMGLELYSQVKRFYNELAILAE